jgi:hypothetical protein
MLRRKKKRVNRIEGEAGSYIVAIPPMPMCNAMLLYVETGQSRRRKRRRRAKRERETESLL